MEVATNIKDHWIIDTDYSSKEDGSKETHLVLNSILSMVDFNKEKKIEETNYNKEKKIEETNFDFEQSILIGKVPVLNIKSSPNYKNYISKSQSWTGYVIKMTADSFFAKLEDRNNPSTYETAQFEMDEVSPGDLELLKVGALFYWSVGYANQNGQVMKQSIVRFKRTVEFSLTEFDAIAKKADDLYDELNWD